MFQFSFRSANIDFLCKMCDCLCVGELILLSHYASNLPWLACLLAWLLACLERRWDQMAGLQTDTLHMRRLCEHWSCRSRFRGGQSCNRVRLQVAETWMKHVGIWTAFQVWHGQLTIQSSLSLAASPWPLTLCDTMITQLHGHVCETSLGNRSCFTRY